jgi:hypothetical protein
MSLRVRASRTTVTTESRRFQSRFEFGDGLNVLRADNNMGKTTTLTSILYALGWEGMLGPSRKVPFVGAVTSEIADPQGRFAVLASSAMAEFEDGAGRRLTVGRPIRSESERTELVHTWDGPALSAGAGDAEARDFYVRERGAAAREAGYQHRLAEFAEWQIPQVSGWDGGSLPLYIETIAPYLFVEQTRGWSWIAAVMPRYLRIRDPEQRATEFLLSLQSLTKARERDALLARRDEVRDQWRSRVEAFLERSGEEGARVENLPRDPTAEWPPAVAPTIRLLADDRWSALGEVLASMRAELADASREIPRVGEIADQIAGELASAEAAASELSGRLAGASRDVREQRAELREVEERLEALKEDRARYDDAIRLRAFGSRQDLDFDRGHCPTCDQVLPATLLGTDVGPVMTLEENRTLIDEEAKTFGAVREDAREVLVSSVQRQRAIDAELNEARREIRSLKATLTQSASAPSQAAIARQVRLGDRIERLEALASELVGLEEELGERADAYRRVSGELAELAERGGLTDQDRGRLADFQALVREQLAEYGFNSVPAAEVEIAPDDYMPVRGGLALRPHDLSASDCVRMVWAYLIALLELARSHDTAHPGLLILDEPGQQDIQDESLRALFARLAVSASYGQQVIVATSKSPAETEALLGGTDARLLDVKGYVLKPEEQPTS